MTPLDRLRRTLGNAESATSRALSATHRTDLPVEAVRLDIAFARAQLARALHLLDNTQTAAPIDTTKETSDE